MCVSFVAIFKNVFFVIIFIIIIIIIIGGWKTNCHKKQLWIVRNGYILSDFFPLSLFISLFIHFWIYHFFFGSIFLFIFS